MSVLSEMKNSDFLRALAKDDYTVDGHLLPDGMRLVGIADIMDRTIENMEGFTRNGLMLIALALTQGRPPATRHVNAATGRYMLSAEQCAYNEVVRALSALLPRTTPVVMSVVEFHQLAGYFEL